jgi:hypothetical protein
MAAFYPIEAGALASPNRPLDGGAIRQKGVIRRSFTLAAQTTSDTFEGITLPKGFRVTEYAIFPKDAAGTAVQSLGSSTLALGISGTTGKYRAAATVTANVTGVTVAAPPRGGLAADEAVIVTIAAATLPATGSVEIEFWGTYE